MFASFFIEVNFANFGVFAKDFSAGVLMFWIKAIAVSSLFATEMALPFTIKAISSVLYMETPSFWLF